MRKVEFIGSVQAGTFGSGLMRELRSLGWEVDSKYDVSFLDYLSSKRKSFKVWLRVRTYLLFPAKMVFVAMSGEPRIMVVTSGPFFLPYLLKIATDFKGSVVIHWLHDLYPQALAVNGLIGDQGLISRLLFGWMRKTLLNCNATVFLGARIREIAKNEIGPVRRSEIIPIGAEYGIFGKPAPAQDCTEPHTLTLLYSGQMGQLHEVQLIIDALTSLLEASVNRPLAIQTRPAGRIVLIFQASGQGAEQLRQALEPWASRECFHRVRFPSGATADISLTISSTKDHDDWVSSMSRAQVAIVTMKPGAEKVLVPSKTYSAMLAGQAILAICPVNSDLADLVLGCGAGWVVSQSCDQVETTKAKCCNVFSGPEGLLKVFEMLLTQPNIVADSRLNSLRRAQMDFTTKAVARRWDLLLSEFSPEVDPNLWTTERRI